MLPYVSPFAIIFAGFPAYHLPTAEFWILTPVLFSFTRPHSVFAISKFELASDLFAQLPEPSPLNPAFLPPITNHKKRCPVEGVAVFGHGFEGKLGLAQFF